MGRCLPSYRRGVAVQQRPTVARTPRRVGSVKENGEAVFFVAREGAALPLVEFDFNLLTLIWLRRNKHVGRVAERLKAQVC